jgi:DNA replication protein DnaC
LSMQKILDRLPISNSSNEKEKPKSIACEVCGKDRPQLFLEIPLVGNRWVYSACECKIQEQEKFKQYQEQQEKKRKIQKILRLSSSMDQLKTYTWENLTVRPGMESAFKEVKEAVENFKDRGKLGVLLFGESGNGKTHITAAGANDLLGKGYSVIFLTEKDLLSRFRESDHFDNEERFFEIMNACLQADLLVWDDFLSSQKLDNKEKDWIFQVVNGRERANKPIWFTSNLSADEVRSSKYARVLDDKERTWWRIIGNSNAVYNRATNYRKLQAISRTKSIPIEEIEGL